MSRRIVPGRRRKAPKPAKFQPPRADPFEPGDPGDAVAITLWKNPLRPDVHQSFTAAPGWSLIEWLQAFYPNGFGRPIAITWNGNPIEVEETDRTMQAGDVIGIYVQPGDPASIIVSAVLSAIASLGATMLVNVLFGKPNKPTVDTPKPDPVYDLSGASNAARLGEPIPAIYGRVFAVPDWAMQPYSFFLGNEQYLDQILVLGFGRFTIENVLIGETPVTALAAGAVQYWIVNDAEHANAQGFIEDNYGIAENVITSPEVSNQELGGITYVQLPTIIEIASFTAPSTITWPGVKPAVWPAGTVQEYASVDEVPSPNNTKLWTVASYNPATGVITINQTDVITFSDGLKKRIYGWEHRGAQSAGPFVVGKPGVRGNRVMCDVQFPAGLYQLDTSGAFISQTITITITCQPITDAGVNSGAAIVTVFSVSQATNTPLRRTFTIDVPVGRYSVKMDRTEPSPINNKIVNNFVWTGLKFRLVRSVASIYGPVTLLAIRIKATNGITSEAARRIRVVCTRQLPPLGVGARVATRSPADAFCDMMTNLNYGARRPLSEVDTATLAGLQAHWAGRVTFDAVFSSKTTVWDALVASLQPAAAAPLPDGQFMSAVQDGAKALRTQFYSDANMVRGSLQLSYGFARTGDHDGYRVEYRDPATFSAAYALYPPSSLDPEQAILFGCTSATTAAGYARLLWQRRQYQRRGCSFTSELEGMLPRFGDRIAVSSEMPKWGQSGTLLDASGLTVVTDEPLAWTPGAKVMMLRGERGEPSALIPVTRGVDDFEAVLSVAPGFPIITNAREESTHYAFGDSTVVVRDFIVANIEHAGGVHTRISALAYDLQTWDSTLPWLVEPI